MTRLPELDSRVRSSLSFFRGVLFTGLTCFRLLLHVAARSGTTRHFEGFSACEMCVSQLQSHQRPLQAPCVLQEQKSSRVEVQSGSAPYTNLLAKPDTTPAFHGSCSIQRIRTKMSRSISTKTSTPIQQLDQVSKAIVSQGVPEHLEHTI